MKPNIILRFVVTIAVLVLIHYGGLWAMTEYRVMENLLSMGPQSGVITIALALSFLFLRLIVFLILPGWIIWRGSLLLFDAINSYSKG